jgi:murein DD-endopeptidase MepM/ murein hydrolase activator NlpD
LRVVASLAALLALSVPSTAEAQPRRDVEVEVAAGETLWSLAQRFDVPVQSIREVNHLGGDALRLGQRLRIPGALASAITPPRAVARGRYVVREGDTFSSIATAHAVGTHPLRRANPGVGERELRPGMELALPPEAHMSRGEAAATPSPPRTRKQRTWMDRAARLGLGTTHAASQLLAGLLEPAWKRAAGRGRHPESFRWPAPRGWFVRGFGSGRHGGHLAIDIMADMGQRVIAADTGLVAYADDGIRGYGQMVLLLHPGGWITAYAHNSAMLVVPGQRVRRGDHIARVGQTGNARGPHVHFMWITEGGPYCDPLALFRPHGRHRDGRRIRLAPITVQGAIPSSVRCRPRPARIDDSAPVEDDEEGLEPSQAPEDPAAPTAPTPPAEPPSPEGTTAP